MVDAAAFYNVCLPPSGWPLLPLRCCTSCVSRSLALDQAAYHTLETREVAVDSKPIKELWSTSQGQVVSLVVLDRAAHPSTSTELDSTYSKRDTSVEFV